MCKWEHVFTVFVTADSSGLIRGSDLFTNLICKLGTFGVATQITGQVFGFFYGVKAGSFDDVCMTGEAHVPQHHYC